MGKYIEPSNAVNLLDTIAEAELIMIRLGMNGIEEERVLEIEAQIEKAKLELGRLFKLCEEK